MLEVHLENQFIYRVTTYDPNQFDADAQIQLIQINSSKEKTVKNPQSCFDNYGNGMKNDVGMTLPDVSFFYITTWSSGGASSFFFLI